MNTWNALPERYHHNVYNIILTTLKSLIQQAGNPAPAEVIGPDAAQVANAILLDYLISAVVLEEHKIRSTDPNIPIGNNWTDDELHFEMPVGCEDLDDDGDIIDNSDDIPTASRQRPVSTELERLDLQTSDGDTKESDDIDNADADQEEGLSQPEARLMQTSED
jgi:hypothetical protein